MSTHVKSYYASIDHLMLLDQLGACAPGRVISGYLPPSPPAEKSTARQDEARETSTGDWSWHRHGKFGQRQGVRDDGLFRGFPLDTSWRRVSVDPSDFQRLKYIGRDADWLNLSGGSTRLVQDGARNLDSNPRIREKVRGAQREIEQGRCTAELILIEADDSALVVVEGHTRATAYAVLSDRPFLAFLGRSRAMSKWAFV